MDHSGSRAVAEWLLLSQVVGYTAGTVIVLLLSVLVRRAARVDDSRSYALLVTAVLLWNAANLAAAIAVLVGVAADAAIVRLFMAVAYSGGALSPAGALVMWGRLDRRPPRGAWLVRAAIATGAMLVVLMWAHVLIGWPPSVLRPLWMALAYHVMVFFALGAWTFYGGHTTTAASRVAIAMAGLGAITVGLTVALQKDHVKMWSGPVAPHAVTGEYVAFEVVRQVATHVMTLGALFFLARFRFADVFIRQSVRMIAAVTLGLGCVLAMWWAQDAVPARFAHATAAVLAGGALLVATLALSFVHVDRLIVALVDRWLFQQPDYDAALRRLRDDLSAHRDRADLHAIAAMAARDTLALQDARIVSIDAVVPASRAEAIPIRTSGHEDAVLAITPGWDHPTLLAREIDFLRAVATALGERLDIVHREREEIDRRTREADLRRQVSEATLRALQAQINPHFLFNTLNTIAHLIQEDPAGAEAMTLRLAEVFSHVLTGGHRPFSSVGDEMDFLRTYLTIEEARFGDRLRVAFDVDPRAVHAVIPSLILQPAVENALKHGLSRKIGPGHLTISAAIEGADLRLSVEDDGIGPDPSSHVIPRPQLGGDAAVQPHTCDARAERASLAPAPRASAGFDTAGVRRANGGVGLRNISERLQTLYADRATLRFEPGPRGGSLLTVRLPLHHHDQEPAG